MTTAAVTTLASVSSSPKRTLSRSLSLSLSLSLLSLSLSLRLSSRLQTVTVAQIMEFWISASGIVPRPGTVTLASPTSDYCRLSGL